MEILVFMMDAVRLFVAYDEEDQHAARSISPKRTLSVDR